MIGPRLACHTAAGAVVAAAFRIAHRGPARAGVYIFGFQSAPGVWASWNQPGLARQRVVALQVVIGAHENVPNASS